jgi:hypothetical protein
MGVRLDPSSVIYNTSMGFLSSSSEAFKQGNVHKGFDDFKLVFPTFQNKVYEQIWVNRERPLGNGEYGRHTFHNEHRLYSNPQEKAEAIDRYLLSMSAQNANDPGIEQRLAVNEGYEYTWVNGNCELHPRGYPPSIKIRELWCPKTKEECLQVGVGVAAAGSVLAAGMVVMQILSLFRK